MHDVLQQWRDATICPFMNPILVAEFVISSTV